MSDELPDKAPPFDTIYQLLYAVGMGWLTPALKAPGYTWKEVYAGNEVVVFNDCDMSHGFLLCPATRLSVYHPKVFERMVTAFETAK